MKFLPSSIVRPLGVSWWVWLLGCVACAGILIAAVPVFRKAENAQRQTIAEPKSPIKPERDLKALAAKINEDRDLELSALAYHYALQGQYRVEDSVARTEDLMKQQHGTAYEAAAVADYHAAREDLRDAEKKTEGSKAAFDRFLMAEGYKVYAERFRAYRLEIATLRADRSEARLADGMARRSGLAVEAKEPAAQAAYQAALGRQFLSLDSLVPGSATTSREAKKVGR